MEYHGQNLVAFWTIFHPFTSTPHPHPSPRNTPKNENLKKKKKKKHLEILSFYTSVPEIMIICYTVPEIWHVTNVIVIFYFGLFFCPFTPLPA